jgi:two-component system, NtrC family, response regulator AtoC
VKSRRTVMIVEDDAEMRAFLDEELCEAGYDVVLVPDGLEALKRLGATAVDVVVTDLMMPGMRGRELLSEIRAREPGIPVVIITAFGSIDSAVDAMRAGAFHYVAKPFKIEHLLATVESAVTQGRLWHELGTEGAAARAGAIEIIAESLAMQKTVELTLRAAPAASPVLLLGESGTGKELLARSLHAASPRHSNPFLAINCSAIPEHLLESQLFGHRRGAFTDAREDHRGLFQEAHEGTLLLDEIGDMAPVLQSKLLRVLQEHEIQPVGSAHPVPADVRIVAATHADLERMVREGRFRQDLYYRLNVISVRVPPLRERMEDLLPLVRHFLGKHGRRQGKPAAGIDADSLEALRRHDWPGNVRELENCIERALVLGHEQTIGLGDLPPALRLTSGASRTDESNPPADLAVQGASLADLEREHILRTLRAVNGNRAAAARLLNVDRKTLYRKLKQYGDTSH